MLRILLADEHKIVREGIRSLFDAHQDITVVAEAQDGFSVIELAAEHRPDVILMDVAMPRMDGIEATRRLLASGTGSWVIALSGHFDYDTVLKMLDAGASGYLTKDCAFEEAIRAVHAVAAEGVYLSVAVAEMLVKANIRGIPRRDSSRLPALSSSEREVLALLTAGKSPVEIAEALQVCAREAEVLCHRIIVKHVAPQLMRQFNNNIRLERSVQPCTSITPREKEILDWLREGKSSWEMSRVLSISQDTVKHHVKNIIHKLNAVNRTQAVATAISLKLIDP